MEDVLTALAVRDQTEQDLRDALAAQDRGEAAAGVGAARRAQEAAAERLAAAIEACGGAAAAARDDLARERGLRRAAEADRDAARAGANEARASELARERALRVEAEAARDAAARGESAAAERTRAAAADANARADAAESRAAAAERRAEHAEGDAARCREAAAAAAESRAAVAGEVESSKKEAEVHRQRRLAARSELLGVMKALEESRGAERVVADAVGETLRPRLVRHGQALASLVARAAALAARVGVPPADARSASPTENPLAGRGAVPPYLGELADDIARLDVGLELVAQSLALLDEGLDAKLRGRGCLARVADALQGGGPLAHPAPGPKRPRGTGYLRVQVDGDEL